MKSGRFSACVIVVLGMLTILAPYVIFPVCDGLVATASGGAMPMKCFWTARAAAGLGGPLLFAGLVLFFAESPAVRFGVALMLLPIGLLILLVPWKLIGVCAAEAMPCHMGTLPALCLLSLFTGVTAAAIAWRGYRMMRATRQNSFENREAVARRLQEGTHEPADAI